MYPPGEARAYFDSGKENGAPVAGPGQEASWDEELSSLDVIDGDVAFFLQPLTQPLEGRRPAAEALARDVLANAS